MKIIRALSLAIAFLVPVAAIASPTVRASRAVLPERLLPGLPVLPDRHAPLISPRDRSSRVQRLMTAAADGDRAAVEPLFAALWPIALGYATRFLGDAALAEDCAQDALVKLFGQLDRFDRERDALTWALTHATWQCRTARRRRDRRGETATRCVASRRMRRRRAAPRSASSCAPHSTRSRRSQRAIAR